MANPTATIDILVNSAKAKKELAAFSAGMMGFAKGAAKVAAAIAPFFMGAMIKSAMTDARKLRDITTLFSDEIDASQIQQFANELQMVGGQADEAYSAIEHIQKAIDLYRTNPESSPLFNVAKLLQLQIDSGTNALDILEQLRQEYDRFGNNSFFRQGLQGLGIGSANMMRYLSQPDEQRDRNSLAAMQGVQNFAQAAKMVERFDIATSNIKRSLTDMGASLLVRLEPLLGLYERGSEWLSKWRDNFSGIISLAKGLWAILRPVVKLIGWVLGKIGSALGFIWKVANGLLDILGKIMQGIAKFAGSSVGKLFDKLAGMFGGGEAEPTKPQQGTYDAAKVARYIKENRDALDDALNSEYRRGSPADKEAMNTLKDAAIVLNLYGVDFEDKYDLRFAVKQGLLDAQRNIANSKARGN